MLHHDEEFESDAIEKCSRSLSRLDDRAKLRVIKYLVERFNLIAKADTEKKDNFTQNIQYQQNNLVLASPEDLSVATPKLNSASTMLPKEALIKGLTKNEPDLLLLICHYVAINGNKTFTKQLLLDEYKSQGLFSDSRRSNLGYNLNSLIKRSLITPLNDEDFSLTDPGMVASQAIMNGTVAEGKKRKQRTRKAVAVKGEAAMVDASLDKLEHEQV